jgi:hypothetical protein
MEDAGIIISETLVLRNDLMEEALIQSQIGHSSQEPAITQFSLLHVKSGSSFHEQLGVTDHLLRRARK